jgi:hypothetical protein
MAKQIGRPRPVGAAGSDDRELRCSAGSARGDAYAQVGGRAPRGSGIEDEVAIARDVGEDARRVVGRLCANAFAHSASGRRTAWSRPPPENISASLWPVPGANGRPVPMMRASSRVSPSTTGLDVGHGPVEPHDGDVAADERLPDVAGVHPADAVLPP